METRPLIPEHLEEFRSLWIDGLTRFPLAFLWDVEDVRGLSNAHLTEMLERGHLIGLFENGSLIGFAGVVQGKPLRTKHRATIGPFYVAPDFHGTNAADRLMTACIERAVMLDVWMIDLFVASGNERANRFYQKHGFKREGIMPASIVVDGVAYDDFYYCLELPH